MREYIIKVMSDKPLSEIASGESIMAIAKTSGDCDEVIRCKDCIKKELCSIFRDAKHELGFCAWAARKEE